MPQAQVDTRRLDLLGRDVGDSMIARDRTNSAII